MKKVAVFKNITIILAFIVFLQPAFAQKYSEPPETTAGFFRQNFPLDSTLKQIDAEIASSPDIPELWNVRAELLASHGRHKEAVLSLEKAMALIPEPKPYTDNKKNRVQITESSHSDTLFAIGKSYLALNRREEAKKALHKAIIGRPPHMMACIYLGNIYLDEDNSTEALKYYELRRQNLSTSGKISKGNALYNLKRYDEAIKEYEAAAHRKPELTSVMRHLGDAYFHAGRNDDAIKIYQRYIKFARQNKIAESEISPVAIRLEQLQKKLKPSF